MVTKPKGVMSKLCDEVEGILGASSKIPYIATAKHLRGKLACTFTVENGYSLVNFCSSMLVDLHCQLTRP